MLVLKSNEDDTYRTDFQKAFFSQGQTLIRGIIFFGTPFKGSRSANLGVKLATNLRLPLNRTHIMYLRVEDRDVAALVNNFDKITEQEDLSLLIFFELKKTKVFVFREHVSLTYSTEYFQLQLTSIIRSLDETLPGAGLVNGSKRLASDWTTISS